MIVHQEYLENKIESLLSKVEGVGKTQVIVSVKNTAEKIIATDSDSSEENVSENDSTGGSRISQKTQSTSENIMMAMHHLLREKICRKLKALS